MSEVNSKKHAAVRKSVKELEVASAAAKQFAQELEAAFNYRTIVEDWGVTFRLDGDGKDAHIKTPYGDLKSSHAPVIEAGKPQIRCAFTLVADGGSEHSKTDQEIMVFHIDSNGLVSCGNEELVNLDSLDEQKTQASLSEIVVSLVYALGTRAR